MSARPFLEPVLGEAICAFVDVEHAPDFWIRVTASLMVPPSAHGAPQVVVVELRAVGETGSAFPLTSVDRLHFEQIFINAYNRRRSLRLVPRG